MKCIGGSCLALIPLLAAPCVGWGQCASRGRPAIDANNNLVTDHGDSLRGEHFRLTPAAPGFLRFDDPDDWRMLRDVYHLNVGRLLIYRHPANVVDWEGTGPCAGLSYDQCCGLPGNPCTYDVQADIIPMIDAAVDVAAQVGMYVIIDFHSIGDYDAADVTDFWTQVAPRYENRAHVIYEMCNEPRSWPWDFTAADVQFEEDMYALIRSQAPETPIILWSFAFSGMSGNMKNSVDRGGDISYANAVVGFHPYSDPSVADIDSLRDHYPAVDTEIGGVDSQEYSSRTAVSESAGLSWVWLDGWNKGLAVTWPADAWALEDCCADVNGDGVVNITDLGLLLANFGTGTSRPQGDLNGDGKVDLADLGLLLNGFGDVCFEVDPGRSRPILTQEQSSQVPSDGGGGGG